MNLFLCISVAEGCMLFVAALVSNQLVTIVIAAGVTVFMSMPSSIFRRLTDLPKFFWRYPIFLFFLALKHKESASSLLQTTKTYLDKLLTRTPLKDTNVASRRHQPLYPLSAQEGLSSPIS
ncbi:hypothetical protein P8452_61630 [Trifolium repens]|nr:hypothetical protein P8452_61630 [Trifolium repens]